MKSEKNGPRLIIDIDITTQYPNHVVRNTIATCPLVKWCTVKYDISTNTGYSVILHIKYKGIKKPYEIVIDKIDQNTMYKLYDALLNCIKYKTVDFMKDKPASDELIKDKLVVEPKTGDRYVTLKVDVKYVMINLFDFDDTHESYRFDRLN